MSGLNVLEVEEEIFPLDLIRRRQFRSGSRRRGRGVRPINK